MATQCPLKQPVNPSDSHSGNQSTHPTMQQSVTLSVKVLPVYRWRELPQVPFLSRQQFCHDKHVSCREKSMFLATKLLSRQNYVSCDKIFLSGQNLSRQIFAAKNTCLSRQNFCRDKNDNGTRSLARSSLSLRGKGTHSSNHSLIQAYNHSSVSEGLRACSFSSGFTLTQ